ncbi:MAG: AGE family epimerase/isomerase [Pyrinomonadaceae bacterium]
MSLGKLEISDFRRQIESEWMDNIAPFWLKFAPDEKYGGFRGLITNDLQIDEKAEKGIILNSRILWTFSHADKIYREKSYLEIASRAFQYLTKHFFDKDHGGVFWTVDYTGAPLDTKKRPYAQAFALYALSEFYSATNNKSALDKAFEIFYLLEKNCQDKQNKGYFETFERDWTLAKDQRLSEVDANEKKSMNTHLHILEAYANLYRATGNSTVKDRLRALINIFLDKIIHRKNFYLQMFFDDQWTVKSAVDSLGHDIEASWLLWEAAEILGDEELLKQVQSVAIKMANAVYDNGLASDGSLLYEAKNKVIIDRDRDWWVQAEAVVGFLNAYQLSKDESFLTAAARVWEYITEKVIDRSNGEWFWKITDEGLHSNEKPKLSQWKCPYHNGRMCFEAVSRLREIEKGLSTK